MQIREIMRFQAGKNVFTDRRAVFRHLLIIL